MHAQIACACAIISGNGPFLALFRRSDGMKKISRRGDGRKASGRRAKTVRRRQASFLKSMGQHPFVVAKLSVGNRTRSGSRFSEALSRQGTARCGRQRHGTSKTGLESKSQPNSHTTICDHCHILLRDLVHRFPDGEDFVSGVSVTDERSICIATEKAKIVERTACRMRFVHRLVAGYVDRCKRLRIAGICTMPIVMV